MVFHGIGAVDCTVYPALLPNPDVSGIGIRAAFLGTAYLTLACCITKAIIDRRRIMLQNTSRKLDRWSFALGAVITGMSDQQVITGISMIVGGLSQLQSGIQIYHWESIVNLAWFSTMTHLLTLTILRDEVRLNKPIRLFRILGMGILLAFLIYAIIPIGFFYNSDLPKNFPAWCLYNPSVEWQSAKEDNDIPFSPDSEMSSTVTSKRYSWLYISITVGFLIYSFCTRLAILAYDIGVLNLASKLSRGQPGKWIQFALLKLQDNSSASSLTRYTHKLCFKLLLAFYASMIMYDSLLSSRTWEITWLSSALIWGTFLSFENDVELSSFDAQRSWTFGQVVSVALLVLPFISFLGTFFSPTFDIVHQNANSRSHQRLHPEMRSIPPYSSPVPGDSSNSFRAEIVKEPWFKKGLWLCYLFCLAVLIRILINFKKSLKKLDRNITWGHDDFGGDLIYFVVGYFEWTIWDFMLLWILSTIFLEKKIQKWWSYTFLGRLLSRHRKVSIIVWTIFIVGIMVSSMAVFLLEFEAEDRSPSA